MKELNGVAQLSLSTLYNEDGYCTACAAEGKEFYAGYVDQRRLDHAKTHGVAQPEADPVDNSVIAEIVRRIVVARAEKEAAERSGYDRDALRLDGAVSVLENLLEDLTIAAGYIHEDELPADIPQTDYDKWYAQSFVPNGVGCRVGPPLSTTTPTTAAVDRSYADGYNNGFRHGLQSRQPIDYLPAQQPEVEEAVSSAIIETQREWRLWLWNEFQIDAEVSNNEARAQLRSRFAAGRADAIGEVIDTTREIRSSSLWNASGYDAALSSFIAALEQLKGEGE